MRFAEYLKSCRLEAQMIQQEVVEELYRLDPDEFAGVNLSTYSRWERGATMPGYGRIATILELYQQRFSLPLPCIREKDPGQIEGLICEDSVGRALGGPSRMVLDLPLEASTLPAPLQLVNLREHPRAEEFLEIIALLLHARANTPFTRVSLERFHEWIQHPANLFTTVSYRDSFLGLLFALRLRHGSFRALLRFEKRKEELSDGDFAAPDEEGSVYLLSLFSFAPEVAAMLLTRLFAQLIARQEKTEALGYVSSFPDAQRLAHSLGLEAIGRHGDDGSNIVAYRNDLFRLMRSPLALQTLFPRRDCDESAPSPDGPPPGPEGGSGGDTPPD